MLQSAGHLAQAETLLGELMDFCPDDASLQTAIAYHLFSISITSEDAGEKRRLLESIMDILNALLARDALPADFQAWPDLIREQLQELSAETIVQ